MDIIKAINDENYDNVFEYFNANGYCAVPSIGRILFFIQHPNSINKFSEMKSKKELTKTQKYIFFSKIIFYMKIINYVIKIYVNIN